MIAKKSTDQLLWEKFFPEEKWHYREEYIDHEHGDQRLLKAECICGVRFCDLVYANPSPTTNAADYLRLMGRVKEDKMKWRDFLWSIGIYKHFDYEVPPEALDILIDPARGCAALVEFLQGGEMTNEEKKYIDDMDYESMLSRWRFAPVGDPIFQGECGEYYAKVMAEKREKVGNAAHVAASKFIGWERP